MHSILKDMNDYYSLISLRTVYSEVFSFRIVFPIVYLIKNFLDCAGSLSSCSEQGLLHHVARGFSLCWPLLLWSTGSVLWHTGPRACRLSGCSSQAVDWIVAYGLSCSVAWGIFPGQPWNSCPLHWQADSYPLDHRGRTEIFLIACCLFN